MHACEILKSSALIFNFLQTSNHKTFQTNFLFFQLLNRSIIEKILFQWNADRRTLWTKRVYPLYAYAEYPYSEYEIDCINFEDFATCTTNYSRFIDSQNFEDTVAKWTFSDKVGEIKGHAYNKMPRILSFAKSPYAKLFE
jgi:hypothetical protein